MNDVKEAYASDRFSMAQFILISLFIVEQRWRYFIDRELEADGITTNQWLMVIVIAAGFKAPPSIREVADALSTTHQNVKQIAAALERRGFMTLERDPANRRIIRLKVTDRCFAMFKTRDERDAKAINRMFENLTDEEMKVLFDIMAKMAGQADTLYTRARAARSDKAKET